MTGDRPIIIVTVHVDSKILVAMTIPTLHTRCLVCEKEVVPRSRRTFHPLALNNRGAREFFIRFIKPSFVFPPDDDDSLIFFVCTKPCFSKLEQGASRVTAVESIIRELSGSPDATLVLSSRHTPSAGAVGVGPQPQTPSSEVPRPVTATTSASTSISDAVTSSVTATRNVPGSSQQRQLPNAKSNHTTTSATSRLGKRRLHGGSSGSHVSITDLKRLKVADPLILFTPLTLLSQLARGFQSTAAPLLGHHAGGLQSTAAPLLGHHAGGLQSTAAPLLGQLARGLQSTTAPLLGHHAGGLLSTAAPLLGHHAGGLQSTAVPSPAICLDPQTKQGSGSQMSGRAIALTATKPSPLEPLLLVSREGGGHQSTAAPVHVSHSSPRAKEGGQMSGTEIALATAKPTPQGALEQPVATLPSTAGRTSSRNTCGPILVTQVHGKSVRKFLVAVPYRRIVASLRYRNPEYTARTIMKTPRLKEAIIPEIAKHIQAECNSLCAMLPQPSVLRIQSINHLKEFHWDLIINELKQKAPTLLAILIAAAHPCRRGSQQDLNTHVIAMAAAILLKQRNSHLCLPQAIIGTILHSGHTAKKVFGRLSKLGVCVTYESASRTVKALGISKKDPASGLKCEEKTPGWTLPCLSLLTGPSKPATTSSSEPSVDDPNVEHPHAMSPSSSGNFTSLVLAEDQPADSIFELDPEEDQPANSISELDQPANSISELNPEEDQPADISELDPEPADDISELDPEDISDLAHFNENVEMFYDNVQVDRQ